MYRLIYFNRGLIAYNHVLNSDIINDDFHIVKMYKDKWSKTKMSKIFFYQCVM